MKNGTFRASSRRNKTDNELGSIYDLLYFTSKPEINAYFSQMKEELRQYFIVNPPHNAQDIFNSIEHTQIYDTILSYESEIGSLKYIVNKEGESWDDIKEKIVKTYNNINKHDAVEKLGNYIPVYLK